MIGIENIIGFEFKDKSLLNEALTHPSINYAQNTNKEIILNYERLELLGDAVLNMVVTDMLCELFPLDKEGELAKKKMALICRSKLSSIAMNIGLGQYIIMAENEKLDGGEFKASNLENALEALIGAIYKDAGLEAVKKFILKYWYDDAKSMLYPPRDAKTILQEWSQGMGLGLPVYVLVGKSGLAHEPTFTIEAKVGNYDVVSANGNTKRSAEQKAAALLLKTLNIKGWSDHEV